MLADKPAWVEVNSSRGDRHHQEYPEESIAEWHARMGLTDDD